jgi:hypothetical protein
MAWGFVRRITFFTSVSNAGVTRHLVPERGEAQTLVERAFLPTVLLSLETRQFTIYIKERLTFKAQQTWHRGSSGRNARYLGKALTYGDSSPTRPVPERIRAPRVVAHLRVRAKTQERRPKTRQNLRAEVGRGRRRMGSGGRFDVGASNGEIRHRRAFGTNSPRSCAIFLAEHRIFPDGTTTFLCELLRN